MKTVKLAAVLGVLALSAVFADDGSMPNRKQMQPTPMHKQGEIQPEGMMNSGYTAPAEFDTQGWDVFLTGSFLYWQASGDGLSIGTTTQGGGSEPTNIAYYAPTDGKSHFIDGGYRPGFKVGLGFKANDVDSWTLYTEYTWFQHTYDTAIDPSGSQLISMDQSSMVADRFTSSVDSEWKYHINLIDMELGRPCYIGKRFILNPFFGLRGGWFLNEQGEDGLTSTSLSNTRTTLWGGGSEAKSWTIGPRIGVDSSWLLGMGFRLIANAASSVRYERYTTLKFAETQTNSTIAAAQGGTINNRLPALGSVRVDTELDLGLGWGMYFYDEEYHIDFEATYDFNVFWNGNMAQFFKDYTAGTLGSTTGTAYGFAPSNLFLHGLTVKARFDF